MKTAAGAARLTEITCNYVTQPESSWQLVTSVTRLAWLRSWHCSDPRLPVVKKLSGSELETSETLTRGLWPLSWCLLTEDTWHVWQVTGTLVMTLSCVTLMTTWQWPHPGHLSGQAGGDKFQGVSSPGTSANQRAVSRSQSEAGWVSCDTGWPGLDKGQLIICIQTRSDSGYQDLDTDQRTWEPGSVSGVPDTSSPVQHKSNKILNVYWDQTQ